MQSAQQHRLGEQQQLSLSGGRTHRLEQRFISELTNPAATRLQREVFLLAKLKQGKMLP